MARARTPDDAPELVYGRNPVRELIAAGRRRVLALHVLSQLADEPWVAAAGVTPVVADRAALGRLVGTSDHQGVVAETEPYPYVATTELLRAGAPVVCLDGAQDPRNIGAVARVAEAAGAAGLVIPSRGVPGITPVVCKTSAGAVEHLAIARTDGLPGFLHDARGAGRTVAGADADDGRDVHAAGLPADTVLVMGSEGEGLRPRVKGECTVLVRIPMRGRVASLNLAVATGVLLYALPAAGPET